MLRGSVQLRGLAWASLGPCNALTGAEGFLREMEAQHRHCFLYRMQVNYQSLCYNM